MKRLKAGIIGLGRSGWRIHAACLAKMPEMYEITAAVDAVEDRRKKAASEFGCEVYEDYSELFKFKELDFIVNAAPSHLHVPVTLDLLNNGFNVVCEKPLAGKLEEVDMLADAAQKACRLLTVFQNKRFVSYSRQIKKVIDSGLLGRIVQISIYENSFRRRWDWQTLKEYNGGNLLVLGSHLLDEAICFTGMDEKPEVACILDKANTFGDADDYTKVLLYGKGKPVIDIEVSSCCAYPSLVYNIQGTCGGLTGSPELLKWKYFKPGEAPAQQLVKRPLVNSTGDPVYCSEDLKWYEDVWINPNKDYEFGNVEFYTALYKTLTEGIPPETTLQQVRLQVGIIEECLRTNPL